MSRWKQPPLTNVIIAAEKREKAISMVNKIFARPNPPVRFHEWSITVRRNIRRREADGTSSEDERRRAGVPPGFRVQEVAVEGGRAANGPPGKSVRFHLLLCLSYRPSRKFPPFTLFKICLTHWFNAPPSRFILLPFKRGGDPDRRVWTIVKMKKKKIFAFWLPENESPRVEGVEGCKVWIFLRWVKIFKILYKIVSKHELLLSRKILLEMFNVVYEGEGFYSAS